MASSRRRRSASAIFMLLLTTLTAALAETAPQHTPNTTANLTVGGFQRQYRLFLPPNLGTMAPLIIVLHGTYGSGEKMERFLGFDALARQHGFVVAYPDAYRKQGARFTTRWNDGRGVLASSDLGVDDVAFLAQMIDAIASQYAIDRHRVFVTGASNGGIMAYRAGCALGGKIRAVAPMIGNLAEPIATSCAPTPGLSILSINGGADPIIPLDGGSVCQGISKRFCEGGAVVSRAQSMRAFARANGCAATPTTSRRPARTADGTQVEDIVYADCQNGTTVRSIVVHGMGHAWPPLRGQLHRFGASSGNLDTSAEIVAFFLSLH